MVACLTGLEGDSVNHRIRDYYRSRPTEESSSKLMKDADAGKPASRLSRMVEIEPIPWVPTGLRSMKTQLRELSRYRTTRIEDGQYLRGIREICGTRGKKYQFRVAHVDRKTNVKSFGNLDSFYLKAPLKVFEHLKKMVMFDYLRKNIYELEGHSFFDLH